MVYINFFNITCADIKFLCALPFIQFSYCETSLKFINIVKWITLLRIKLQIKKPSGHLQTQGWLTLCRIL